MSTLVMVVPLAIAAVLWAGLSLLNRRTGWLRVGEVIFWDVILLILVYLVWLRWF